MTSEFPADISNWLPEFVAAHSGDFAQNLAGMPDGLRQIGAMFLFGTLGCDAVLLSSGAVWLHEAWPDNEPGVWRLAERWEHLGSLVVGAERYPELLQLLPPRPDGTLDCPVCRDGAYAKLKVICNRCGSLGWVEIEAD